MQVAPVAHAVPQVPQFRSSESRFTHVAAQTSGRLAGQHWPGEPVHVSPVAQTVPHAPQFRSSWSRFTQRVGATAGHLVGNESGQVHVPAEQISFVSVHAFPQADRSAPQLRRSVSVFVQNVPQSSSRGATHRQIPPEQPSPGRGQALPHAETSAPQFSGSVAQLVQNVPQSSGFAPKHPHAPPAQLAPGFVHGVAHAPHAAGSVRRSRQRGTSASQRVAPPAHWQTPPEHVPDPQATPHAPQFLASVW